MKGKSETPRILTFVAVKLFVRVAEFVIVAVAVAVRVAVWVVVVETGNGTGAGPGSGTTPFGPAVRSARGLLV